MTWRPRIRGLIFIALGLVAAGLLCFLYLMYLNPVSGEEIVPAGYARNTSSYVTMRDGTRLAADVWVPSGLGADQRRPAIMITTRYWRAHAMGPTYRLLVGVDEARVPNIEMADQWNGAGYALVLVDARGSGASSGKRPVEWSDAEVADLGEITQWITSQPWSNGNVGAIGISYSGNTAELSAIPAHPALRAVAPLYSDFDPQFFLTMPGGVYNRGFVEAWNAANQALDANNLCALEAHALEAHVSKVSPRPTFETDAVLGTRRFTPELEAGVYFCILEALQNCSKYAPDAPARVELASDDGWLVFSVIDQGPGFDQATTAAGSGLQNIADRLAALGGGVDVRSQPGAGTSVSGRLPMRGSRAVDS